MQEDLSWLDDVNKAAQYLTSVTLETSAEAALLTRGTALHAYAGQFPRDEVEELAQAVLDSWDQTSTQRSQVRLVRMSNGQDYLLYSTMTTSDVVLSMVFAAETPLRAIRQQSRRLIDTLRVGASAADVVAAERPAAREGQVVSTDAAEVPVINPAPDNLTQWESPLAPPPADDRLEALLPDVPAAREDTAPADWTLDVASTGVAEPDTAVDDPQNTAHDDWPTDPVVDAPEQVGAVVFGASRRIAGVPGVFRTPHGLYKLSYAFLWLPKIPDVKLRGDVVHRLETWFQQLTVAYDWRLEELAVAEDYVMVVVACSPADSPENVVRTLMDSTSERVMTTFPHLAQQHPSGQFWAPGYLVVTPGRALRPEEIARYIAYQRQQQGLK